MSKEITPQEPQHVEEHSAESPSPKTERKVERHRHEKPHRHAVISPVSSGVTTVSPGAIPLKP